MLITVRVHPRASRATKAWNGDSLELWITAPPVDGKANAAVLRAVAIALKIPVSAVRLYSGARGRTKVVDVTAGRQIQRLTAQAGVRPLESA